MRRREWLTAIAGALASPAWAAGYPARPVKLLVGAPPGGPGDFLARIYAKAMGGALGESFIFDNRPGASGTLAAEAIARSPADGQALLVSGPAAISAAPHLLKLGYDPSADLVPVSLLGAGSFVLAVHPSLGIRSLRDLRALAAQRVLAYGSAGNGSASHLCMELFCDTLNVRMTHVPYKGEAQAMTDLLAGAIQLMFTAPNVALRHAHAGTLRLVATTAHERMRGMPSLPTASEAGADGFEYLAWQAVFAPAATSHAVVAQLAAAWNEARMGPEVRTPLEELGMASPERIASGEPLAAFVRAESERLGRLIRKAGIKAG
jgi:tripartite-type tricarboxylate transporter receptor subunit TctC